MSFHNSSSNLEDEIHELVFFREFRDVVCRTHRLAGVQVWGTPWHKQYGLYGCRSLSSVKDHCCYIVYPASTLHMDHNICGFNNVCFKHRLIEGEGVVGRAFATQQPWFSTNVSSIPKSEYPLSECACMFGLRSAIAVPFQIIHTHRTKNFVSEFFLPFDCTVFEEQMKTAAELISTLRLCDEEINKKRVNFPEIQFVLEPINEYEQYETFSKYLLVQEENRGEALNKILLPEPSNRNKICPEIPPSTDPAEVFDDAIGQGSLLSMTVSQTRHARRKEINYWYQPKRCHRKKYWSDMKTHLFKVHFLQEDWYAILGLILQERERVDIAWTYFNFCHGASRFYKLGLDK